MVWPVPTTIRITPEVPAISHWPFDLFYVFDVDFVGWGLAENYRGIFGEGIESFVIVEGEWRDYDAHADLEAAADF